MVSSGITVNDECVFAVKTLDKNSTGYVIFSIRINLLTNKQEIMIEDLCEQDADHDEFLQKLPPQDNRYAMYRVQWESIKNGRNEGKRNKTIFIHWCPQATPVKSRFVYAASKQALKNKLQGGVTTEIETGAIEALSLEKLIEKCKILSRG